MSGQYIVVKCPSLMSLSTISIWLAESLGVSHLHHYLFLNLLIIPCVHSKGHEGKKSSWLCMANYTGCE